MPSIDVSMARSLRGGVSGILARSLQHAFHDRSIITDAEDNISDVKTAFSSWDNCMEAVYCKWPVIALIIIGSLIILSIVYCISRCLCCGLSCCCECCQCLKCCGNCCGCCDPPNGRRRKYLDEPYKNLPPEQGYQAHEPMSTGAMPFGARPDPTSKSPNPPQYAQFASFDVSKKGDGEDSLPAMPTWGDAENKKVEVEAEAMELKDLKKPEAIAGQTAPLMNGMSPAATPGPRTPVNGGASPYGPPSSQATANGYPGSAAGVPGTIPYGNNMPGQGYHQAQSAYGRSTTSFNTEQSWGVTGSGYNQNAYAQDPSQMSGYDDQTGYNQYGVNGSMQSGVNQQYGMGPTRSMTGGSTPSMRAGPPVRSMTGGSTASMRAPPPSYPDRSHGSPAPQQDFAQDRQFDPRIAPQRTYSPAPIQQQGQLSNAPPRTFSPAPLQGTFPPGPQGQQGPPRSFSPAPQRSFSPGPQGQQGPPRSFSPAPQQRSSPAQQQRQWSADTAPGRGPPGRGLPFRQYSTDSAQTAPNPQRQYSEDSYSQRQPVQRAAPQRQYTADIPPGPKSPNFSRPTRSNTYDNSHAGNSNQQEQQSTYPGKW